MGTRCSTLIRRILPRAIVGALLLACLLPGLLAPSVRTAAGADNASVANSRVINSSYGGTWVRDEAMDKRLGYVGGVRTRPGGAQITVASKIDITIDEKPDGDLMHSAPDFMRAQGQVGPIATGRIRYHLDDEHFGSKCMVSYRAGKTYLWYGVTNVGMIPMRVSHVPGSTRERDLLIIGWLPRIPAPTEPDRAVTVYRRKDK